MMRTFKLLSLFFFLLVLSTAASDNLCKNKSDPGHLRGNGMLFTPNKGQIIDIDGKTRPEILFTGDGGGYKTFLTANKISYVLSKVDITHAQETNESVSLEKEAEKYTAIENANINGHRFDVEFIESNTSPKILTENEAEGYFNFYYPHCTDGITDVKAYNKLVYENVYDNINIVFYGGKQQGLKYDWVINPGADYKQIKFKISGADGVSLHNNSLQLETSLGTFKEYTPKVYQIIDNKIIDIECAYEMQTTGVDNKERIISYKIGNYNRTYSLVIDPINYWLSYLGGSSDEGSNDISADKLGNMLITGYTRSINFPTQVGAFQTSFNGAGAASWQRGDVFISKFSETGALIWSTYFGGTKDESGTSIAVDANNNIAVCGYSTSTDFPVSSGCYQFVINDNIDQIVIKLSAGGVRSWATYIGGDEGAFSPGFVFSKEVGFGIDFDLNNDIIISGQTNATNFPVTNGSSLRGENDITLSKFSASGNLVWSEYIGGSAGECRPAVAYTKQSNLVVDHNNDIVLCGHTSSKDFPVTPGCYQPSLNGNSKTDAIIVKADAYGTVKWATYFGGNEYEFSSGLDVDNSNNIYISGITTSLNFPTLSAAQSIYGGGNGDGFLAKFNPTGNLLFGTYNGGPDIEYSPLICVSDKNFIYYFSEAEESQTTSFPIFPCAFQNNFGGMEDQYITKYDANGNLLCNTWIGGPSEDDLDAASGGITCYKGFIYATSNTYGPGYPVTANAYQTIPNPGASLSKQEITLIKICGKNCGDNTSANASFNYTFPQRTICDTTPVSFSISNYNPCDTTDIIYEWLLDGNTIPFSSHREPNNIPIPNGAHNVRLTINTTCGIDTIEQDITINSIKKPIDYILGDTFVCSNIPLQITIKDAQTALWNPPIGVSNPKGTSVSIILDQSTFSYEIKGISTSGCNYTLPLTVSSLGGSETMFYPNTFTPNNDGLNEIFLGYGEEIHEYSLTIFDRWGTQIFSTNNPKQGWTGRINGNIVPEGIYVWKSEFKSICFDDKIVKQIGHVNVLK